MTTPALLMRMIQGGVIPGLSLEAQREYTTVLDVLGKFFTSIKIDKKLARRIYQFQIGYVNTSQEYVEFFGSNLLGVHVVRFKETDVLRFFNEVLEIDFQSLVGELEETETFNSTLIRKDGKRYAIAGDVFNLTLMYLIHRCLSETTLQERDRHRMALDTALIFFYRSIAALLSAYFTYPADPKIAQAAYSNLSYKFLIKKLGSWHKVMDYRANELITRSGIYHNRLVKLSDDEELIKLINGAANQMKEIVKSYYAEFAAVHQQGESIGVTHTTGLDAEGSEVVRDRIRDVDRALVSIKQMVSDPKTFVRDELIRVITDINKNTSPRLVKESLNWISEQSGGKDHRLIDEFVTQVVVYSYNLIKTRMEPSQAKDIGYVLIQLKNFYLSTRSTDPDLLRIREMADEILIKAHRHLSDSLLLSTRTAIILYITFRTIVGQRPS